MGWQVGRRYSDFIWLRLTLRRFYPSQIVPPIPNKKAHKRSPRQLQKRMKILTLFLNDLLAYPEFLNSRYVEGFLSYPQAKFNSFKKQVDNKKSFQSISTTQTSTGEITVTLNKQIIEYNKEFNQWVQQNQSLFKELTRSSKAFQRGIIGQVNTLYEIGDKLANLHQNAEKLSKLDSRPNNGFFKMKEIFVTLNNMFIEWGGVFKNQIDLISTNCNIIYKYIRQSLEGCREVISQVKEHQKIYFQTKITLDQQKQKLFNLHDIQKWQIPKKELAYIPKSALYEKKQAFKIMLPRQSSTLQKLKKVYSYYLSRIYENADLCMGLKANLLCESMEEFTIKQKVINQQIGEMWNQMASNFSNAFEYKSKNSKVKKLFVRTQEKLKNNENQQDNNEDWSQATIQMGIKK